MSDAYAEAGYTTLMPDLFNGDFVPDPRPEGFEIQKWIAGGTTGKDPHTPEQIDPVVVAGIQKLKEMGFTRIAAVGYCFGAKYLIRNYKNGIDVGFVAHPSFVDEAEFATIPGPLSIAAAEEDTIFPAENRHKSEEILRKIGVPFQINLYSGTQHGFGVRGDPKVKSQKYAKERAFQQAVDWFNEHL
jgi:dienelactone hydrolase